MKIERKQRHPSLWFATPVHIACSTPFSLWRRKGLHLLVEAVGPRRAQLAVRLHKEGDTKKGHGSRALRAPTRGLDMCEAPSVRIEPGLRESRESRVRTVEDSPDPSFQPIALRACPQPFRFPSPVQPLVPPHSEGSAPSSGLGGHVLHQLLQALERDLARAARKTPEADLRSTPQQAIWR